MRLNNAILAAIALVAIAAWPFLVHRASASQAYVAPVLPDYAYRDATIAFFERRVRNDAKDQISAKLLAAQYVQRYRETQDVGDLLRGIAQARRSLRLQPQNNAGADAILASAYTALHQFHIALRYEKAAHGELPTDSNAPAQIASLEMEIGDYAGAAHALKIAGSTRLTPTVMAVQARYDELTGKLDAARDLLQRAAVRTDEIADNSAQARAWYHFRLGELAFSAGDASAAQDEERVAIEQFPGFEQAYRALARFCWARKDWNCALHSARKAADIVPAPESLGYEADAQQALGDPSAAAQTQALIFAIERIGNAYRINDRLLAVYYCTHGVRIEDAYRIAQREARARGPEIYAQDTLAWCAAMDGKWLVARRAISEATRYGTQDPRILYHAGMIAQHFGDTRHARQYLQTALALNPQFDPFYADRARAALSR